MSEPIVRIAIPEKEERSYELYGSNEIYHEVIKTIGENVPGFSVESLLAREGPQIIRYPAVLLGFHPDVEGVETVAANWPEEVTLHASNE